MDFRYTEEQTALQETLQRFVAREYGFGRRRELARSPLGFSAEAWQQYAALGILGLPLPAEHGGLGGNGVDLMVVMEQFGRGLMLEPFLSTVVLAGGLIAAAGSPEQRQRLLPRIAGGELQLALAAHEAGGRYELTHVHLSARRSAQGWQLEGNKAVVRDAPAAEQFLVSARTSGAADDPDGITLFLVPRLTAGVGVLGYATQDGGRAGDLELRNVCLPEDAVVGTPGAALPLLQRALERGAAALSAEAVGIMDALNEATLAYLKARKQFGVPIGTFQALQHRMADMYIAAEQARSMAMLAAVQVDSADERTRGRAVSAAKAYVGRAARFVGQQAVQMHGAMGMIDDVIVSHYFKRLTMIDMTLGDADFHLARFSDALLAETP